MDDDIACLFGQKHILVNQNIPQYDGNISSDKDSFTSEIDCTCCDILSDGRDTTPDQDYDLDEQMSPIPVHISQRDISVNSMSLPSDPPPWYEEHIPRVIDLKQSQSNRKTIRRDNRLISK